MPRVQYGATAAELVDLYREYDWWADRDSETVRDALRRTDEVVTLRADGVSGDARTARETEPTDERGEHGRVLAAARVLTDYTFYATVYDVIVRADRRGEGLGRTLLEAVVDHPRLADVTPMLLAREGLVPFYESCGFEPVGPVEHPDGDPEPLDVLMAEGARDADEAVGDG